MSVPEANHKVAEVEGAGDQNSPLSVRDGEHVLVWKTVRMLSANSRCIMTESQEMRLRLASAL
jgi:hypothetical protein